MLALRVIPCLDVKDGRVVKGVNFLALRDAGDPVEQARTYDREGADEVTFLDIGATHENRDSMYDVIARTAEEVFIPLTVGGGIRSVEDIRRLLLAGADKASINSAAVAEPEFVSRAAPRPSAARRSSSRWMRGRPRRGGGKCSPMAGGAAPGSMPWAGRSAWLPPARGRSC